jgi:hypothetical protein
MPCRGAKYCRFVLPILVDVKKRRLCQISLKTESLITIRITPTTPRAVKTSLIVFGTLLASSSGDVRACVSPLAGFFFEPIGRSDTMGKRNVLWRRLSSAGTSEDFSSRLTS